jgi:uncharacterized protein YeaO (DUF488 family)
MAKRMVGDFGNGAIKPDYEPSSHSDGTRVLVDRLWLRGAGKQEAHVEK